MERLQAAWLTLLGELARRAPATRGAIRPPAAPGGDAEARLPVPLNAELRFWFGLHDGCEPGRHGEIFPFNFPVDLPTAVEGSLFRRKIWQDAPDAERDPRQHAGTIARTWLDQYVVISRDGMGGGLFADLRPGVLHGCVRWWDKVDADDSEVLSTSVTALLGDVTRSLRTGRPMGGWAPRLGGGILTWKPSQSHRRP